ncbi:unnamed protein product [Protopolystoma xenopodis]|uniref:Uncharacterized protein n=1 Tax=Protopolystoma xenopodis TaxID=117903 RepID=A0A3S5AM20_9PLAT|nr:unnamed protein product [Protopolystoma xenopodis]
MGNHSSPDGSSRQRQQKCHISAKRFATLVESDPKPEEGKATSSPLNIRQSLVGQLKWPGVRERVQRSVRFLYGAQFGTTNTLNFIILLSR